LILSHLMRTVAGSKRVMAASTHPQMKMVVTVLPINTS
jgi:hypothetical protein